MSLIAMLIIGGIIGWLGAQIMGREEGIGASILIGIVGAVIGGFIARLVGSTTGTYLTFTWSGFVWSLLGAIVFCAILNGLQHRHHSSRI